MEDTGIGGPVHRARSHPVVHLHYNPREASYLGYIPETEPRSFLAVMKRFCAGGHAARIKWFEPGGDFDELERLRNILLLAAARGYLEMSKLSLKYSAVILYHK